VKKIVLPVLFLFALTLIGCAASQRPVLYPNNYLKTVGSAQADRDINDCMQTAETYVKKNQDSKVAEPSPVFKQFTNRCLKEKGYEPMGWQ
jgi:hypothetical protein